MGFAAQVHEARWRNAHKIGAAMRIMIDETAPAMTVTPDRRRPTTPDEPPKPRSGEHDLQMVEQLLERCWRELDAAELNVKLTDVVRLLELKGKIAPAAEAEATFWELVDVIRQEELADFGDTPDPDRTVTSDSQGDPE
jgi:hypothetical protein